MAHFRGTLSGKGKGRVGRTGNKKTGIVAKVLGPQFGGSVHIWHDHREDQDKVTFAMLKYGDRDVKIVGTFWMDEEGDFIKRFDPEE